MQDNKTILPLHKTVHFRRLRELITEASKQANIAIDKYDMKSITCYRTNGKGLMGSNVSFRKINSGRSCFVYDNNYEVYEIPCTTNKDKFTGDYLLLVKNVSFEYYLLVLMNYKIDLNGNFKTEIVYTPLVYFEAVLLKNNIKINNLNRGFYLNLGSNSNNKPADMANRFTAYRMSDASYIRNYYQKYNKTRISNGNVAVKIYNKNKKTNNGKR